MQLTWTGARFECTAGGVEERKKLSSAGFHFDWQKKKYWTGRVDVAKVFEGHADFRAKERFNKEDHQINLSRAIDSNAVIPAPAGKAYMGFQKAGIAFALARRNTLIADEMGLGKTIQAIGVINAEPKIKNVLVIPPASLKINWKKELMAWLVHERSGGFAYGNAFPDTEIVIINYDIVKRHRAAIDKRRWDLVVMDESHYLKNPETQRTRSCLGYDARGKTVQLPIDAGMRLFLTGTPILNRPVELWPIVRIADAEGLGSSHWTYAKRYCKAWEAPWGWDFSGASNLEELQQRLRASIMIRRLKRDVLKELPPKRRQVIAIPDDKAKAAVKAELDFYQKHTTAVEQAMLEAEQFQAAGDEASYNRAVEKLKEGKQAIFEEISILRHATAVAKIPYVLEYLDDVLEDQDKVVVFAYHRDVVEAIYQKFKEHAVMMHGGINIVSRQEAVDKFQTDPECKIIIGTIGTMGVGWTLTAASYALFVELDWVPANINQAEDRLHRMTQLGSVLIHHLVFDGSLDATMAVRIVEKQEIIDRALDNPLVIMGETI